jgi:chromosome segregation ATPase
LAELHGINPAFTLMFGLFTGLLMFFVRGFFSSSKERVEEAHSKNKELAGELKAFGAMVQLQKEQMIAQMGDLKDSLVKSHARTKERHGEVTTELKVLAQKLDTYVAQSAKLEGKVEQNTEENRKLVAQLTLLSERIERLTHMPHPPKGAKP